MDLSLLPMFEVFADCLSLTETGRRLGLTQPAVHGQMRRLGESVGELLYVRRAGGLVLTSRGEQLAVVARDINQTAQQYSLPGAPQAPRLAAGRGAWTHLLVEAIGPWLRTHHIRPMVADGPEAVQAVREGRADIGLSTRPPADLPSLPLRTVGTVILAPHPLPAAVSLAELSDQRWILPSLDRPHRQVMDDRLRSAGVGYSVVAECNDWDVMVRWVQLGIGMAAVNSSVRTGQVPRATWIEGPTQTYSLFWRAERRPAALDALPAENIGADTAADEVV